MASAIGATAISSVRRSDSMHRSTSSRSKRAWSRTVAPASAAASRFNRPRMCDGGVATWNRSSSVSPRTAIQCWVPAASDACVCTTAFGIPVVPDENTRIASSSCELAAESDGFRPILRPVGRVSSVMSSLGSVSARAWSTSRSFQAGLINTDEAPSDEIALTAKTNSTRLVSWSATRSPGPTPSSVDANASRPSTNCDHVYSASPRADRDAVARTRRGAVKRSVQRHRRPGDGRGCRP